SPVYALYSFGLLILPIVATSLASMSRFMLVNFPLFVMASLLIKRKNLFTFLLILFYTLQIFYWIGWQNYYWIA
ncbi:MAG: hypothetical protein LWX83_07870, partial [Anaerolineae bacterium]|nr:hypothetical protein [Anaerolineae bacterium]